jgi:hypothetical protein
MNIFTPQLKHHILTQYRSNDRDYSFQSLAIRYGIKGGKGTIQKWHQRWKGTPESLMNKQRSGRPRILTRTQVYRYISQPIIKKNPIFLLADKASIHKKDLLQAFHDMGCQDIKDVWLMPTQAAKRMSPLDNALFHIWKDRVRKHAPLTQDNVIHWMTYEWMNLEKEIIHSQYHKCLLFYNQDPYADCPDPFSHQH